MYKSNRILFAIILSILTVFAATAISFGNSAEPPSILIIVPDAPDDLEIEMFSNDKYIKADKLDKTLEKYYTFSLHDLEGLSKYKFKISTEDSSFEILLDEPLQGYNNVFTLNIKKQTLTSGKLFSRTLKLVSLRITLTLIIEGLIFLSFGYREKRSWIIFLVINLLTQGFLNIWLNGFTPMKSYIFFALIFGEIWVFIAEAIGFSIFIKEHNRSKTIGYVLLANFLSLIAGGYLISLLPL